MNRILIGHINPDSDTVCSPIAYSWYLNQKEKDSAKAYISGKLNHETEFILKHFNIETPEILNGFSEGQQVVIMDTNNFEELLPNIEKAQIVEIVDHHKLFGNLKSEKPATVTMLPLACTATIVWQKIKADTSVVVTPQIAGVMLCAIISDTLKFTSPTTTEIDKNAAEELASISNESIDSLAESMFEAKSDLTGMSNRDILTVDSKIFEMGSKKVRVSVMETTNPQKVLELKENLEKEIAAMKSEEKLNYMFFFVIDILKSEATVLTTTPEESQIAQNAFHQSLNGELLVLPGVVSRKKQIIPSLEPVVASI